MTASALANTGLTSAEAADRAARGLGNSAHVRAGRTYWQILRSNVFTFINTVLFSIVIALVALGEPGDGGATASLVVFNVIIGTFQEMRAKRQLEKIALLVRPTATVIRDGEQRTLDPSEVVQGDVLIVNPGDQVVVDGKVVGGERIRMDESLLTGESEAVEKAIGDTVMSGSFCMAGKVIYEAEKVGASSFINTLTAEARSPKRLKTPLQSEVDSLVRLLLFIIIPLGALITMSQVAKSEPVVDSIRIAAVVVALLPQGLFFMTTVAYAMGIVRVSRRRALIQQLNSVESISHVNVLCLDKTGTLTTNRITLGSARVVPGHGMGDAALGALLGDFAASTPDGNRTIEALKAAFAGTEHELVDRVQFSSEHKWSALAWRTGEAETVYVMGAPEAMRGAALDGDELFRQIEAEARTGARVLLFAEAPHSRPLHNGEESPVLPESLKPLGLLTFAEEVRSDARSTIEHFRSLGIELKVISGDNPETVAALCKQVGFDQDIKAVSGLDLDETDEAAMDAAVAETAVFGRITPRQKEALVQALHRKGKYVAMIGDGVNDVLALKQANVGVSMQSGSQATRGVADIILLNDSFGALPAAFREGQRIMRGMEDVVRLLLVRSFYLILAITFTQIAGLEFPISPRHNAVIALLTVGIPIVAIAAWARPGPPARSLLRAASGFVFPAALLISTMALAVFFYYLETTDSVETARSALTTVAVLAGVALIPFVEPPVKWMAVSDELSGDWRPTFLAAVMLCLFIIMLATGPLRRAAQLELLGAVDYAALTCVVIAWFFIQREVWKLRLFKRFLKDQIGEFEP
jgi:cation-transporting ATPase E